ncbi:MAG: flagellar export protein FliJ [Methylococcales bacterium]|nr:flagellar export protein FliJ [Methylococcales bacterium]
MKRPQRLKVIVDLNAEKEKKMLETLGGVQRNKQESQAQLENLQQYQQEYLDKYKALSEAGMSIAQLLEFRSFVDKLEKAAEEQRIMILDLEHEAILARKQWEMQHQKTNSLEKVYDLAIADEKKKEEKREQNEQDDRAARLGRKNGTRNA